MEKGDLMNSKNFKIWKLNFEIEIADLTKRQKVDIKKVIK
jgi:hypothetical protein